MNQIEKGTVVSVLTTVGEIVGRFVTIDTDGDFVIEHACMLMMGAEGVGLAPGISMGTDHKAGNVTIRSQHVVSINPARKELADGWLQQTSGIVLSNAMPRVQ